MKEKNGQPQPQLSHVETCSIQAESIKTELPSSHTIQAALERHVHNSYSIDFIYERINLIYDY